MQVPLHCQLFLCPPHSEPGAPFCLPAYLPACLSQIPAVLQPVLGVEKKQRQLLRAAAGHKKHLELLASLYAIVADGGEQQHQPAAGASAAAAAAEPSVGGGTTATNGRSRLREFAVLSKRGCSLPGWWNLEDDVALADAALEFGYASGQQRRTLEQAFAAPGSRWHGIWRIKADPEPGGSVGKKASILASCSWGLGGH